MKTRPHPTHHRPFIVACGLCVATAVICVAIGRFLLDSSMNSMFIALGIPFAMMLSALLWTWFHTRRCTCPECGRTLLRDRTAPPGEFHYPCHACEINWVSLIQTGKKT